MKAIMTAVVSRRFGRRWAVVHWPWVSDLRIAMPAGRCMLTDGEG